MSLFFRSADGTQPQRQCLLLRQWLRVVVLAWAVAVAEEASIPEAEDTDMPIQITTCHRVVQNIRIQI